MLQNGKLAVRLNTLSYFTLLSNTHLFPIFIASNYFTFVRRLISQVVAEEKSGSDSQLMESCMIAVKSGGLLPILPGETMFMGFTQLCHIQKKKMQGQTYCKGPSCIVPVLLVAKAEDVKMCSSLNKGMGEGWSPGPAQ